MLTNSMLAPIIKKSKVRLYSKGQTIIYPDDPGLYVYFIKSGAVTMYDIDAEGNNKILYIFGPPTLFPMVSFIDDAVSSSWFYTALVDTEVYCIPYAELKSRLKEVESSAAYNLILAQALREAHERLLWIADHNKTDSSSKLISALLFLLEHHTNVASNTWRLVLFPVPHQLLADMTGLTRETISLTMKEFAKKHLVKYQLKGQLEINYTKIIKLQHV